MAPMLSFKINYSLYVVLVWDMGYWLKIEVDCCGWEKMDPLLVLLLFFP